VTVMIAEAGSAARPVVLDGPRPRLATALDGAPATTVPQR